MSHTTRLKLRSSDGQAPVEFPIESLAALTQQIAQRDLLSPSDELWCHGNWVRLDALPDKPWLEQLLRRLDQSLRQGDAIAARRLSEKIVTFGGNHDAVLIARFALGYLFASAYEYSEAADQLRQVIVRPSCCLAAALNNLGVVSARLRNIPAAVDYLQRSTIVDPRLITAQLSLLNLAKTMLNEGASELPGGTPWKTLETRASRFLNDVSADDIRDSMTATGRFPSYHVLLVLEFKQYFPALSANLPLVDSSGPAAVHRLESVRHQFHLRNYACAVEQAEHAAQLSPLVQLEAQQLASLARLKDQECRRLADQQRYTLLLEQFQRSLDDMTIETMDQPRSLLELLRPYRLNTPELEGRHNERVVELIHQRLTQTINADERARLISLQARFVNNDQAQALQNAVRQLKAAPALNAYRKAICEGDLEMAELAAGQVKQALGDLPESVIETLQDERNEHLEQSRRIRASGFETLSIVWRLIKGGCFQDAVSTLREFLISETSPTHVVPLISRLAAAQRLIAAQDCLRTNSGTGAARALLQALRREPRNRTALTQLLTIEILQNGLVGDVADQAVSMGIEAISALLANDCAACQNLNNNLAKILPTSRLVIHLNTICTHDQVRPGPR